MTLVRVEYNEVILGDSSKTDVLPNGTASYNFTTSFECSPDEPDSLDNIVQKPVLCKYLMPKLPPRGDHADLLCPLQESLDKNSLPQQPWGGPSTAVALAASWENPLSGGLCSSVLLALSAMGDDAGVCASADTDLLQPLNCWSEAVRETLPAPRSFSL